MSVSNYDNISGYNAFLVNSLLSVFYVQYTAYQKALWHYEWMNEWSIYIALYCVLLYTQSALQSYEGVSLQPPPVCSIHLDDATAATAQQRQCAHHTPATGGEDREREMVLFWQYSVPVTILGR